MEGHCHPYFSYHTCCNLQPAQIPADLVDKLERLALVDFRTKQGLDCLGKAIRFADQLHVVDTSGTEPMDSVLEDRYLTHSIMGCPPHHHYINKKQNTAEFTPVNSTALVSNMLSVHMQGLIPEE